MPKKIVFFSAYGNWLLHNQVDAILAKALSVRGQQVKLMLCDGYDGPCASTRGKKDCTSCFANAKGLFQSNFGLPGVSIGEMLSPVDLQNVENWIDGLSPDQFATASFEDRPLGSWTLSSIFTHFRISTDGLTDGDVRRTHHGFLRHAAMIYLAVSRFLDQEKPDAVVLFSGRFYPYKVALEAVRERGIPVIVHERGRLDNSYAFYQNQSFPSSGPMSELLARWQHMPLLDTRLREVANFFELRRSGKGGLNYHNFHNNIDRISHFYERFNIPEGAQIIGFFTSSQDEVGNEIGITDIDIQTNLLQEALNYFSELENTVVIVRHHPHIGGGSNIPQRDVLPHLFQAGLKAPANARIIMPQDGINSYSLFPFLDRAITPFSSIGLETVAYGIPTLTCSRAIFGLPISLHFSEPTPESLRAAIPQLLAKTEITVDELRTLWRYVSIAFNEVSWRFKSFGIRDFFTPTMNITGLQDLFAGNDPALDRLCDHIVAGSPLFPQPSGMAETASTEAESAALEESLRAAAWDRKLSRHRECVHLVLSPLGPLPEVPWAEHLWHPPTTCSRLPDATFAALTDLIQAEPSGLILVALPSHHYSHSILAQTKPSLLDDNLDVVGFNGWLCSADRVAGEVNVEDLFKRAEEGPLSLPGWSGEHLALLVLGHFVFKREALLALLSDTPPEPHLVLRRIRKLRHKVLDHRLCLMRLPAA